MAEINQSSKPEQMPPVKKNWWEAVLTATPVVLTVVATILAGLSTSEMTLAQYHRSLAAQNQSKASDQWGFFQAKRLRGTAMENAFDLLPPKSKPSRLEADDVWGASQQLTRAFQDAKKQTADLEKALSAALSARTDLRPDGAPVREAATGLTKRTQESAARANMIARKLEVELAQKDTRTAFEYISPNRLPEVEDEKVDHPDIDQAVQSISDRANEKELAPILRKIQGDDLQQAIETAEGNARRFEAAGKPIGKTLDHLDQLVREQVAHAADFHQFLRNYQFLIGETWPGLGDKTLVDLQAAKTALDKSDAAVQGAAEEMDNLLKAGRFSYTARRQRRESDYHLKTAGLYEVQVRLNSYTSDRHRTRSKLFFFGMLAAQAGVTIASLSLAVHKRNILWALAGLAGLAAVTFSGYVYLYM
jgi:hypothetical protein